jgi:hypothetical protein
MSKFDDILNKLTEEMPNLATTSTLNPQSQQPNTQQVAIQQAAKLLNMDPKALEQILAAQQQNQKPAGQVQTNPSTQQAQTNTIKGV